MNDQRSLGRPSRRALLRAGLGLAGLVSAGGLLAACGGAASPTAAPAAQPTTAAASGAGASTPAAAAATKPAGTAPAAAGATTPAAGATSAVPAKPGAGTAATAQPATQAGGGAAGKKDVNLWHPWAVTQAKPITDLTKEFDDKTADVNTILTFVPGDQLTQKILASISAGNPPELMPGSPFNLPAFADANGIKDLGPYAKPGDVDAKDVYPGVMDVSTYKGKLVAVPLTVGTQGYYMNADLWKAAGLDVAKPPKTWDDLRQFAKALTKPDQKQWGWMIHNDGTNGTSQIWVTYLYQNGGALFDKDNAKSVFNGAEGVEALQFWTDLVNKDKVSPQEKVAGADITQAYGTGKVGFFQEYPFFLGQIREFKFQTATAVLTTKAKPGNLLGGWYFPIFAKSKNPDAAWTFLMWMFEPENQYRLNIGMGNLPTKQSTVKLPAYQDYLKQAPQTQAFVDQLPIAQPWPALRVMPEVTNILGQAVQEALYAQSTPKQALDSAADKVDALLKQNK